MLTYARDAMAGPLGKLGTILEAVHERRFNPDASRSGRWVPAAFSSKALHQKPASAGLQVGRKGQKAGKDSSEVADGHGDQQCQGQDAVNLDSESADFASQSRTDDAGHDTSPEDMEATPSGEEDADQPDDPPCCSECRKGGLEEIQN